MKNILMTAVAAVFAVFGVSLFSINVAIASQYISGYEAEQKLAKEYSINFEDAPGKIWCYKEDRGDVKLGYNPMCWAIDPRKTVPMTIFIFIPGPDIDDEVFEKRALLMVFKDYHEMKLGKPETKLSSGMTIAHYRVSWPKYTYNPYASVVRFRVGGKNVFAIFFNGSAKATKSTPTPIWDEVEQLITNGRLSPIK